MLRFLEHVPNTLLESTRNVTSIVCGNKRTPDSLSVAEKSLPRFYLFGRNNPPRSILSQTENVAMSTTTWRILPGLLKHVDCRNADVDYLRCRAIQLV